MRVATIDVGTNTALLLIADVSRGGLDVLLDEERFVRLGDGVDAAGVISAAAVARLIDTLSSYRDTIAAHAVDRVAAVATSAFRDAANRDAVAAAVREGTQIELRAISGLEEAELTFLGGVARLTASHEERLTIDIGGGSTELTSGSVTPAELRIDASVSTRCGAVRLRERFFHMLPPSEADIASATRFIDAELEAIPAGMRSGEIVGTSGTTYALAVLEHGRFNSDAPPVLDRDCVSTWRDRLLGMTADEVLTLDPAVMAGRADVFAAGVLVLARAMERVGADRVIVSDGGLRHGVALRLAGV